MPLCYGEVSRSAHRLALGVCELLEIGTALWVGLWRASELMQGSSALPPGKGGAGPMCLGSPRFQHSPDTQGHSADEYIYLGMGAMTCQPPGATFF